MELDRSIMRETTKDFQTYYSPKLHGEVRLDTNTNVLGSNPAAEKYLRESRWDLNGYPDTYSRNLREAIGELYGLDPECIIAGNGSDEMIDVIFKTFTNWGDNSVVPVPSYSLYDYFVKMNGGRAIPVDLTEDFQLDVDSMVRQENAKVTIVPSPNNPTGNCFRQKDLEELISRFDGIVVMDEAYTEYTGTDGFIKRACEFDNLVVTRTFSKVYAMAALRVGYMVANRKLTDMMMSVKIPYSLNAISEGAAVAALGDQDFVRRTSSGGASTWSGSRGRNSRRASGSSASSPSRPTPTSYSRGRPSTTRPSWRVSRRGGSSSATSGPSAGPRTA